MGLNDSEVTQEMNKMIAFIKQEAVEKAREIQVKADEEFNIEKAKYVRSETVAIEAFFEKKVKQVEIARKIAHSNHVNKNRLKILAARQQALADILSEASTKMQNISKSAGYDVLLKKLILQSVYQLMDSNVLIKTRKVDVDIAKKVLGDVEKEYTLAFPNKELKIEIDSSFLPQDSCGGILASCQNGNIQVSNTLESRLDLLQESILPEIRVMLFGHSPNRKFFN